MAVISLQDLQPLIPKDEWDQDRFEIYIDDAVSVASIVAPCILDPVLTPAQQMQFKAILRMAIQRWHKRTMNEGKVTTSQQSNTMGVYTEQVSETRDNSINTSDKPKNMFWPAELVDLESICRQKRRSGTVDVTAPLAKPYRVSEYHRLLSGGA